MIPEYSVWYPATISDSASEMSMGERPISTAEAITNEIKARGCRNSTHVLKSLCQSTTAPIRMLPAKTTTPRRASTWINS